MSSGDTEHNSNTQPNPTPVHTAAMAGNLGNHGNHGNTRHRQERIQEYISRTMEQIRANVSEQELANMGLNALVSQYLNRDGNHGNQSNVEAGHPPSAQAGVTTGHGHTHAHMPGEGQRQGAPPGQFVINIGGNEGAAPDINQNQGQGQGQGQGTQVQGEGGAMPTLRSIIKMFDGAFPFIFLVFAKVMYNHRLGILVFVALFGTFFHANTSLKRHIQLRETQSITDTLGSLVWITLFLSANIFFIYFVFDEQKLYRCLYFRLPEVDRVDMWSLLWMTGMSDFVIKFATIVVKALIAMLPKQILPYKKKGKYYMLVETVSQFYRSLIPVIPWIYFLQDNEHGGEWFSYVLLFLYLLFKGSNVLYMCKEMKRAFLKFRVDVSYGCVPSRDQLEASENTCPICQDKFTDPVQLSCRHIFCEDCVSMWFDRERTCPMCRANIVDNPKWRDGSTNGNLQVY